jgi:hypothetical protein
MQYFRDFCRFFQYQRPALWLLCIEVSQTSSDSEDVSLRKRQSLTVRTDQNVSFRHDNASKLKNRGAVAAEISRTFGVALETGRHNHARTPKHSA